MVVEAQTSLLPEEPHPEGKQGPDQAQCLLWLCLPVMLWRLMLMLGLTLVVVDALQILSTLLQSNVDPENEMNSHLAFVTETRVCTTHRSVWT